MSKQRKERRVSPRFRKIPRPQIFEERDMRSLTPRSTSTLDRTLILWPISKKRPSEKEVSTSLLLTSIYVKRFSRSATLRAGCSRLRSDWESTDLVSGKEDNSDFLYYLQKSLREFHIWTFPLYRYGQPVGQLQPLRVFRLRPW